MLAASQVKLKFYTDALEDMTSISKLLEGAKHLPLVIEPAPILHRKAAAVAVVTDELRTLMVDMLLTMYKWHGIGLAAPQVGNSLQVLIIDIDQKYNTFCQDHHHAVKSADYLHDGEPIFMVNPEIIELSSEKHEFSEMCLSAPNLVVPITRPTQATVRYLDYHGNEQVKKLAPNLVSTCFQHEYEHLQGKTIVDYLSHLKRQVYLKKLVKYSYDKAEE